MVIWTWWALAQGAFFGRVLLPGGILLYAVLALTVGSVRLPIASRGPHAVALAAFLALALWTALSILWTPAHDLALDYAQRAFIYAAAFAAGLAFTVALRRRMILSLVPFLAAGAIVVAIVVVKVWLASDVETLVDTDGTLDFPFGYRNANAGFFTMLAFGSMPVIMRARSALPLRVGTAALASISLSLVAISQSRGSLLAAVAGIVVLLFCTSRRGWALVTLGAVFLPVALLFPMLLDPYEAANTPAALTELQGGITASLGAGLLAALLTFGAIRLEGRGAEIGCQTQRACRRSRLQSPPSSPCSRSSRSSSAIRSARSTTRSARSRATTTPTARSRVRDSPTEAGSTGSTSGTSPSPRRRTRPCRARAPARSARPTWSRATATRRPGTPTACRWRSSANSGSSASACSVSHSARPSWRPCVHAGSDTMPPTSPPWPWWSRPWR